MARILIVEDDQKISRALSVRLQAAGHTVSTAFDAVLGTCKAAEQAPDLILLDISMPGGDGFDVAQRISRIPTTAGTPFIFLTASKEPGLREKAMQLGAAAFFEKPYESTDLLAAIDRTLTQTA